MKQAPKDGAMGSTSQQRAGFAEFDGFYLHRADLEFMAQEQIEVNSFSDDIAPGVLGGKFEAGGFDESLYFLRLNES